MRVGVVDGMVWVADSQALGAGLAVDPVVGTCHDGEVGRLVDECSGLCAITVSRLEWDVIHG